MKEHKVVQNYVQLNKISWLFLFKCIPLLFSLIIHKIVLENVLIESNKLSECVKYIHHLQYFIYHFEFVNRKQLYN